MEGMRTESIFGRKGFGTDTASRRLHGAAVLLVLGLGGVGFGAQPIVGTPLPDGTVLSNLDGMLLRADGNDVWCFELTADARGGRHLVPTGTRLVLLPSATLERMLIDVNDRHTPQYRVTARVTQYGGTNFLLATYFLPLSMFKSDHVSEEGENTTRDAAADLLPDDPELDVPPEILERLRTRRPVRGPLRGPERSDQEPRPAAPVHFDRMLVDRIGVIEVVDAESLSESGVYAATQPHFRFTPYALGWNVGEVRYELLPSRALEQALYLQRHSLEPMRFNVAGLVTRFQGRQYLLLRRVLPVYNYGNFIR